MKKSKDLALTHCFAYGFMKTSKMLNVFIGSVTFLVLSFGLLESSVFAYCPNGTCVCQTTSWGAQTYDWIEVRVEQDPASQYCCSIIGYGYSYNLGYYNTTTTTYGTVKANEIMVGETTQNCVGSFWLWESQDQCCDWNYSTHEYPYYITDEISYFAPSGG